MQLEKNKSTASDWFTASDLFNDVKTPVWIGQDNRCLVPYSHKDPTKWKTYEMHDYRKAFSEETLKKVDQFKYDNNLFNWEDPKVLKYFTKSRKSAKKAWKKTYGFPYVWVNSWDGNSIECFEMCARYVSSYYKIYKV